VAAILVTPFAVGLDEFINETGSLGFVEVQDTDPKAFTGQVLDHHLIQTLVIYDFEDEVPLAI
jgi:hypothetical protein